MKLYPTKFNGYFVGKDGSVWTTWDREGYTGNVRRIGQNLRGGSDPNDRYMSVNISLKDKNGKTIKQKKEYTHKLIAETLIPNPTNLPECNHKNRNKKDNRLENIEWITRNDNMTHLAETYYNEITSTPPFDESDPIIDHIPEDWKFFTKPKKPSAPPKFLIEDLITNQSFKVDRMYAWVKENWDYLSTRCTTKNPHNFYSGLMIARKNNKSSNGFKVTRIRKGRLEKPWRYSQ